ncbi:MAG: MarC family protein [Ignavibacteria bacterium]|nr:MarC family protein [Ignavibacteria bacterium]
MEEIITSVTVCVVTLFPLLNPPGAIPLFCSLTINGTNQYRKTQARKTAINVFLILIVFLFIGKILLALFGISIAVLKIAGGLIVAHTAWEMVTGQQKLTQAESDEATTKQDITFTPMAMPLLSGPGAIGAVIGLNSRASIENLDDLIGYIIGIIILCLIIYLILIVSIKLFKFLGTTGIGVLNRMMGFFILAIAVEMIRTGLDTLGII